jgi:integrase/recombinase XerD
LSGVKDLQPDAPEWNGLTSKQLMRLKAACEQRAKICTRKNQNALLAKYFLDKIFDCTPI